MKKMTFAEVIGIAAEDQILSRTSGSLTDFLGGSPDGQVHRPSLSDTFDLADGTQYFPSKEVNFGDVFVVLREMQKEASQRGVVLQDFTSCVMKAAAMMRREDGHDEIDFRDFIAEKKHEIDIALEKSLGVYEPDVSEGGRDWLSDRSTWDEETKAIFSYDASIDRARNTRFFPAKPVRYLDICVVLDTMKKEAVVKGLNRRRYAYNLYNGALLVQRRNDLDHQTFRDFCKEEKRKLDKHLDAFLRRQSKGRSGTEE